MRASSLNGNSSCLFLGSIVRSCDSLALGSVWSPLKARNPTKTAGLLSCKSMSTNSPVVRVKEKIDLTEKEKMIFDRLLAAVCHFDLSTRLRVAGGWVPDKLCSDPDQLKYLETARRSVYDIWIDFVNSRSEKYSENSCIPT